MVANIISQTLQNLHPNIRAAGFGVANSRRKLSLFIPPSTKSPLFIYGRSQDQRSFLSLGSGTSRDEEEDGGEISRTVSLPSQISEIPQEPELDWLLEEHHRRYSSVENTDDEDNEEESDDDYGLQQDYHGYEDGTDNNFAQFMSRIRHSQNLRQQNLAVNHQRKNSFRSIGSVSITQQTDEDFLHESVTTESEIKKLFQYSIPLIITFLLENVFSLVCVLVVSHLGKVELAAVSLGTMTANIIFAIFEGLSTVLDTLCPQAFGAGDYYAVGVQFQRCTLLGLILFIPFAFFWWFADILLAQFIDDKAVVHLATIYLRIMLPGAPAYIIFENLKRYLQAQGIFEAGTYVLIICAPLNVLLSYLLVWNDHIGMGFIGAPIAVSINFWLMLILLVGYIVFIDGDQCWGGFSKKAFSHWRDLFELAIPGIVMIEAESLSYEVLTLFASKFGTDYLATQSAVSTLASLLYMIPFSVGIASSTRIANFVGARRIDCAKLATRVGISAAFVTGGFNCLLLLVFKKQIAHLFSKDDQVIKMIIDICPLIAFAEIFDSFNAVAGSCLRGQGMQRIGSWINLIVYYVIGVPLAWLLGYYFDYKLNGLWISMTISFFLIGASESWVVLRADWKRILEEAEDRKEDELENGPDDYEY